MAQLITLRRYWETIRHLKVSQIVNRLYKKIKIPFRNKKRYSQNKVKSTKGIRFVCNNLRSGYKKELYKGNHTFTFLNKEIFTDGSWFPESADQLWIYNLHYFDYLFEIQAEDGKKLILDWIDRIPIGARDVWHPYTVSLRACNWIWNYQKIFSLETEAIQIKILNSLECHLFFIRHNIEFDVVGNHLIENCKAIIIGGLFFNNIGFVKSGLNILEKELNEQILPDGGHYECSPMYHCIVLEDLIAIKDCLEQCKNEIPEWLQSAINRMIQFLCDITDSGTFPLLNDSAYGICLPPEYIFKYFGKKQDRNEKKESVLLRDTGIFRYRSEKMTFFFDCGKLCPDFLPAHAHNDMLSYILKFYDKEVITDSGVYEYKKGKWRDYFRSGFAHNCITIDKRNPCDTWESFRVGKRGYPYGLKLSEDGFEIECGHSCYRDIGVEVLRAIRIFPDIPCIYITDLITAKKCHYYDSNIHIAPDFTSSSLLTVNGFYVLEFCKGDFSFSISTIHPMKIVKTWYSPAFGVMHERACITISGVTSKYKQIISYLISGATYEKGLDTLRRIDCETREKV